MHKEGYRHFMAKEIHEQPRVLAQTISGRIADSGRDVVLDGVGLTGDQVRELEHVQIVACGTSWHAGLLGRYLIEGLAGIPVRVDYGSEFRGRAALLPKRSLFLTISQSGETADTLTALRGIRGQGVRTLTVCNVPTSSMVRESDDALLTLVGPEIGVASTKAFTGQILALALLAAHWGVARGTLSPVDAESFLDHLVRLPGLVEHAFTVEPVLLEEARGLADARSVLYLGRGINYPVALEGALKLKELSYIHAEGYPAGEMKHGPIALIDPRFPVVAVAGSGQDQAKLLSNLSEVRAREARVTLVTTDPETPASALAVARAHPPRAPAPALGLSHGGAQGLGRGSAAQPCQERDRRMTRQAAKGTFSMTSEAGELVRLRKWLREELEGHGVPRPDQSNLLLAVGELCNNSIQHAYEGQSGKPIRVSVRSSDEALTIEVEDFGKPFDAEQYEAPNLEAVPDHGYGLFLVKTIADNLSVDIARERGTRWTIVKYRPGRGPAVGTKDGVSRS